MAESCGNSADHHDAGDLGIVPGEDDGLLVGIVRYELYGVRSGRNVGVDVRHGAGVMRLVEGRGEQPALPRPKAFRNAERECEKAHGPEEKYKAY